MDLGSIKGRSQWSLIEMRRSRTWFAFQMLISWNCKSAIYTASVSPVAGSCHDGCHVKSLGTVPVMPWKINPVLMRRCTPGSAPENHIAFYSPSHIAKIALTTQIGAFKLTPVMTQNSLSSTLKVFTQNSVRVNLKTHFFKIALPHRLFSLLPD